LIHLLDIPIPLCYLLKGPKRRAGKHAQLKKTPPSHDRLKQALADARRDRERREKTYREQALKIYPHICARCGREFEGKRLRELTVHHKDHNHDNNPPDGSNWELLCIYCHDEEHSRYLNAEWYDAPPGGEHEPSATYRPFADLDTLLKNKK
jgi:hypothetical protein